MTEKQKLSTVTVLLTIPCLIGKDLVITVITSVLHNLEDALLLIAKIVFSTLMSTSG